MEVCGLDLIYNGKWYLIEANSCPGLDFIDTDVPKLTKAIAEYVCSIA